MNLLVPIFRSTRSLSLLRCLLIFVGSTLVHGCDAQTNSRSTGVPHEQSNPAVESSSTSDTGNRIAAESQSTTPIFGTFKPTLSKLPLRLPAPAVRRTSSDKRIIATKIKLQKFPT